ncbi:gluconeogenesis factor YvcK family protein [Parathermosynechococcus lividus]
MRRANKARQLSATLRPARRKLRLWSQWLLPGLLVKRWLLISTVGVLLASLGLAISVNLTPVFYTLQFIEQLLQTLARFVPSYVSGPLLFLGGIALIWWGYARTLGSITQVLLPDDDKALVERLLTHRRLERGPKIVAIGGGTGLSTLLRGLKVFSANITAIVTMADDGGSSGRLRREIGVLPPGDIRNCLAALADEEKLVTELFQYRFDAGDGLAGHSFGNLFLTAMTNITGDLERAIATSSAVLAIRGQVLPATLTDMTLWARLADGRLIHGESNITAAKGQIVEIGCSPPAPTALPRAIQAIRNADYIILGPGSLYTSVIPNLLVPDIAQALAERRCPCVYVCNIMTQPGETDGYRVSDHVRALDKVTGDRLFDAILVQKYPPSAAHLSHYRQQGSDVVAIDRDELARLNCRLILADVMDETTPTVRHDSQKLATILMRWYGRVQSL